VGGIISNLPFSLLPPLLDILHSGTKNKSGEASERELYASCNLYNHHDTGVRRYIFGGTAARGWLDLYG
jgi:hypothetical protein